jgi:hypothetical protein
MPWYSAQDSLDTLLVGRRVGMMHIVCYLQQGSNVFETYWTTIRGVEAIELLVNPDRSLGDVFIVSGKGLEADLAVRVAGSPGL